MKRSLYFFFLAVLSILVITGCGPSAPAPIPSTQESRTVAPPTAAQIVQAIQTVTITSTPSAPLAASTSSTGCNPPAGWSSYTVKSGDTLYTLAKQVNLTPEELMRANCLTSSLIGVGDTIYLPMESCTPSPPEGWGTYVVRSGDTLFGLATTHDTTVSEIKRVNCLISDSLEVGKQLYLPPLVVVPLPAAPAGAAPPPPPPLPPAIPCPSVFSCQDPALSPTDVPPGIPNDRESVPCRGTLNEPWLSKFGPQLQIGNRLYVYVCEFPDLPLMATVKLPNDSPPQVVPVLPVPANPDGEKGNAQKVIEWPALPGQPTGWYTLTVVAADATYTTTRFYVAPPNRKHILIVPEVGPPGTVFEAYYVYFEPMTTIDVGLYGEDVPVEKQTHNMTGRQSMTVAITNVLTYTTGKGWARQELTSVRSDPPAGYAVYDQPDAIKTLFWLR